MHSEGFPFIVGAWGWTCVRVVLVVSSWSRRGVVVNSLPCGRASGGVLEDILLRVKLQGSLARNARFGASKSQDGRSFSRFAWQAQYFRGVSISGCHFPSQAQHLAKWRFAFAWQAQHFVMCPKCFFHESQCQGSANVTQWQKLWQAQHLVTALKSCGSLAKSNTFGAL